MIATHRNSYVGLHQLHADLRAWWRGEMGVVKTALLGGLISLAGHCVWWGFTNDLDGHRYAADALRLTLIWVVLTTTLMLAWAIPIFRVCMRRMSQPVSMSWTFAVFMGSFLLLVS